MHQHFNQGDYLYMKKGKIFLVFMALFAVLLPGCKSGNNNSKAPEVTLFEKR